MNDLYVVTGAGPVGWTVAEQLAGQGNRVRVLTRSGSGPEHPLVERLTVDVQDASQVRDAFAGATAVFHCIHGSSYTADAWRAELPRAEQTVLAAAAGAGAVVVFPESLYSYSEPDRPMTEAGPRTAQGGKRGVRTELLRARDASPANTVTVVAGDFFGPRVRNSHGGERMVSPVLAGKKLWVIASTDQPHSFTYVPDLAAAMIRAAQMPALWNKVWHAPTGPAVTQRQLATAFTEAGGAAAPKLGAIPGWALRAMGVFSKDLRELAETLYQFDKPFVMDSAASQAALDLRPTPLPEAAAATAAWWRAQG
ncbi:NAD-dependent epimerase/dehydratase family protein [Pseudarthrobacter sulfonivorans]|uniref:NAD-dependent epimerase/dehydratase family protein n=1 Tax=Pseudarthrobacter sulfonivorans TaxID=121292 RepID=UPI00285D04A2|nr:NAD-dependent epimerase/dehydratase family protein [Pseudarthrobacter sulfonivorans]MDR6416517.1 nucleoside-diphosphate-sugar epimerase [Pseudarthrobacter sulfonivorans]